MKKVGQVMKKSPQWSLNAGGGDVKRWLEVCMEYM